MKHFTMKFISPLVLTAFLGVGLSTTAQAADYKINFYKIYALDDADHWGAGELYISAYLNGEVIINNREANINARENRTLNLTDVNTTVSVADGDDLTIKVQAGQSAHLLQDDRCYGETVIKPSAFRGDILIPCRHRTDSLALDFYVFVKKIN